MLNILKKVDYAIRSCGHYPRLARMKLYREHAESIFHAMSTKDLQRHYKRIAL